MDSPTMSALSPLSISGGSKPSYCTPNPVPNIPENNQVKLIDYRGAKIAAFTVEGRELICLPQAFELFLKHLVGGLHTVYTKLKRLEITPVVCNVEQVRILRSLGAIQPGVNRCKLIAPKEFDVLYEDCTNSSARPGRPPKRSNSDSPESQSLSERIKRSHLEHVNHGRSSEMPPLPFRFPMSETDKKLLGPAAAGHPFSNGGYPGYPPHCPPHLGMLPFLPFPSSPAFPNLSPSAAVFYHQTRLLQQQHGSSSSSLAAHVLHAGASSGSAHHASSLLPHQGILPAPGATSVGSNIPGSTTGFSTSHLLGPLRLSGTQRDQDSDEKQEDSPGKRSPREFLQNNHLDNQLLPSESSVGSAENDADKSPSKIQDNFMVPRSAPSSPCMRFKSRDNNGEKKLSGNKDDCDNNNHNKEIENSSDEDEEADKNNETHPIPHSLFNSFYHHQRGPSSLPASPRSVTSQSNEKQTPLHADRLGLGYFQPMSSYQLSKRPVRARSADLCTSTQREQSSYFSSDGNELISGSILPTSEQMELSGHMSSLESCVLDIENFLKTIANNAKMIERFHATASYELRSVVNTEMQKLKLMNQQLFEERQKRTIIQKKWKKEKRLRMKLEELITCQQRVSHLKSVDLEVNGGSEIPQDLSMHTHRSSDHSLA